MFISYLRFPTSFGRTFGQVSVRTLNKLPSFAHFDNVVIVTFFIVTFLSFFKLNEGKKYNTCIIRMQVTELRF